MNKLIKLTESNEVSRQLEFKTEDGVSTISLRYIGEVFWTPPFLDQISSSLDDDGNGFTLRINERKPISLDYSEAFETMVLLTEMFKKLEPNHIPPYEAYIRE